jgi:phage tail-like protein
MSDWFKNNLLGLLPPLYAHNDEHGDLHTFLSLPAGTLDKLKQAIDDFPAIFDVDRCDERFLPLLAKLVGLQVDATRSPECQRRRIREAIEIYRRKGTIPAMRRDLGALGWQGEFEETFRSALRLNARSRVGRSKLPGLVFSLGVFRVVCKNQTDGLRQALAFHHPAGTRCFWLQMLNENMDGGVDMRFDQLDLVRRTALSFMDEAFVLGRSSLGSCRHLTNKQRVREFMQLTSTVEMLPQIEQAAIKVARFHGRQDRMRLNSRMLNDRRLPNTSSREELVSFCTPIYTGPDYQQEVLQSRFGLGNDPLNRHALPLADAALRFCFRQKDFFFQSQTEPAESAAGKHNVDHYAEARGRRCFQLGQAKLNSDVTLDAIRAGKCKILFTVSAGCRADVTAAADLLNRWPHRSPVFRLNANALNNRYLTDANLTGERAALEVYVDTGDHRGCRIETLKLNGRPLNTTGLRLSVDRTRPMRINRMRVNQAGFRRLQPSYRWLFRQQDLLTENQAGFEAAVNNYRVTQWPA